MGKHGQSGRFGEVPLIECKLGKILPKAEGFFCSDNSADKSTDHLAGKSIDHLAGKSTDNSADKSTDNSAGRFGGVGRVVNIFNKSVFFWLMDKERGYK